MHEHKHRSCSFEIRTYSLGIWMNLDQMIAQEFPNSAHPFASSVMSRQHLRSCASLAVGNDALLKVKSEPTEEREKMDAKKKDGLRASWFQGKVQSVYKINEIMIYSAIHIYIYINMYMHIYIYTYTSNGMIWICPWLG